MGAGAIIGAVIAGTTYAAGSTFFGATMLASAITGASIGRIFDKPKSASPTYSFGELDNTRGQRMAVPVTYGRVKVAGNVIYHRISDNEKELFMVIGLGEGPIESVEDIRVNGEPITSIKGYQDHIVRLGTSNQTAVSWIHTGETWPNTAYIACRFQASEDLTLTPTITCVVKGRKVRVWSGVQWATQYSNNPAWCILDLLTNTRYGVGIKERYIDLGSFRSEATYCDELVDDGNGGQEPRFRLDYNVDFQRSSLDLIDEILSTFRGYILYSDGKLRLQIEKSQVPVQSFTMDNIVADSFSYSKASLKEIPNQIRVEWIDPESDWEQSDMVYDNEVDQEERGEVLENSITLYGVTRPGQAGREARWYHDSGYICNTFCEFRVGIDSLHCEVGDIVKVSHDVPGWVEKQFRILEIQEEENDEMVLRCREYNSAIYHDRGSVYTQGRATELPNPNRPPAPVENLIVVETNKQLGDGTWVPQVLLSWDAPVDAFFRAAHIYHSLDKGVTWQHVQRVVDSTDYLMDISLGENRFRVVSESSKGILGDPGASPVVTITVIGKNSPPPDVTWGECSFVDQVELRWNPVNVPDLQAYEVRTNTYWGSQDGLIYRGNGLSHVMEPTQRSYTFHIKALDRSGNYSKNASVITLSLPAPQAPEQPIVEAYFNALKIKVNPLNSPSVKGYYAYMTKGGATDKIPVLAGGEIAYPAPTGTTVTIQVSAYDVLGEGPKSEPLEATTTALTDGDIPDDIVGPSKLTEDLRSDIDLSKTNAAEALIQIGDLGVTVDGTLTEIDNAKTRLASAESEISTAKGRLDGAETRLTSAEAEIAGAKLRLTTTEGEVDSAKTRLSSAETQLGDLAGSVSTHSTKITAIEGELSSKVSQTEFSTLEGTVTDLGTTVTQTASALTSKADKSVVDTINQTVSSHSTTLGQHATAIQAKAEKSTVDTLTGRVTSAEGQLDVLATEISAKVSQTVFDVLAGRVTSAEGQLVVLSDEIAAKVSQTVFEELEGRVSDNESLLSVHATAITARVTQTVFDALEGRVQTAETSITAQAGQIALKASQSEVDTLSGKVSDNEAEILLLADEISAKVSQSVFDTLAGTVSSHGTQISQNATAIEAKAEKSTVDTLTGRMTTAEGQISTQAGQISLKANASEVYTKTETDGIVDGIEIGGRNLAQGTNTTGWVPYLSARILFDLPIIRVESTRTSSGYFGLQQASNYRTINLEPDKTYTLSFKARGNISSFNYCSF